MSEPKYLRNKYTGAIQPYHPAKARLDSMEPLAKLPETTAKVSTLRKVRPFDERQLEKAAMKDMAGESIDPEEAINLNNEVPTQFAYTLEELQEIESNLKSAMRKEDITSIALENFGTEVPSGKGISRKKMKEKVQEMIDLCYKQIDDQE